MAIAVALSVFSDLERSATPRDNFLYQFSTFSEKMKKIYRLEVCTFCKMHNRIMYLLALCLSFRRFQMPFEGSSFLKKVGNI